MQDVDGAIRPAILPRPRVTGTLINVGTILLGTLIGAASAAGCPSAAAARPGRARPVTLVLGVDIALAWRDTNSAVRPRRRAARRPRRRGAAASSAGSSASATASRRGHARQATRRSREGFFTASLLFCVGPLTVVGSIQDGLTGDYQTLATKALLDGFAAIALAAGLGWGVGLAAVTSSSSRAGSRSAPALFDRSCRGQRGAAALTSAGGVLIIGISLKLLGLKDVKVGNFLPALVFAPALVGLVSLFS